MLDLLNVDIEHIGEQSMTRNPKPAAALLAAVLTFAAIWPLSLPVHAQSPNSQSAHFAIVALA